MSAPAPLPSVPGWPAAFRGTAAVAAGLLTPATLRGPRYLRLFPDTYVRHGSELVTRRIFAERSQRFLGAGHRTTAAG
jgi:hypothetical protein